MASALAVSDLSARGRGKSKQRRLSKRRDRQTHNKQTCREKLLGFFFDDSDRHLTCVADAERAVIDDEEEEQAFCSDELDKALTFVEQLHFSEKCFGRVNRSEGKSQPRYRHLCSRRVRRVAWSFVARGKSDDRLSTLTNNLLHDVFRFADEHLLDIRLHAAGRLWLPAGRRSGKVFLDERSVRDLPESILRRCSELHRHNDSCSSTARAVVGWKGKVKANETNVGARVRAPRPAREPRRPAPTVKAPMKFELRGAIAQLYGFDSQLVSLQHREITPEDYEILLQLDASVAPKTFSQASLERLDVQTVTSDDEPVLESSCSVCMDSFAVGDSTKVLPCKHRFHARCIDMWLSTSSQLCPLDGLSAL